MCTKKYFHANQGYRGKTVHLSDFVNPPHFFNLRFKKGVLPSMKIFYTFLSLVFAIYVAVRGVEFIQQGSNTVILLGVGCMFLALGVSYIAVKSALKNK